VSRIVLDCSVTMCWCFDDDASKYAEGVLNHLRTSEASVPGLWSLEVANVLLVAERKHQITPADSSRFAALLQTLPIHMDPESPSRALGDILPVARAHQLSSYDAAYLELAMRLGAPIATLDANVRRAAKPLGVAFFNPPNE
jgi:predicted nucleic acid-binding protein